MHLIKGQMLIVWPYIFECWTYEIGISTDKPFQKVSKFYFLAQLFICLATWSRLERRSKFNMKIALV